METGGDWRLMRTRDDWRKVRSLSQRHEAIIYDSCVEVIVHCPNISQPTNPVVICCPHLTSTALLHCQLCLLFCPHLFLFICPHLSPAASQHRQKSPHKSFFSFMILVWVLTVVLSAAMTERIQVNLHQPLDQGGELKKQ